MDEHLQSLLVIGFGTISETTRRRLGSDFADLGNISTRSRFWLDLEENKEGPKWVFRYALQRDFDNLLDDDTEVEALFCAPIADVERTPLDGAPLWAKQRRRRIQWLGRDRDELRTNPYARRLIRIVRHDLYVAHSLQDRQIIHRQGEGTWPLILNPHRLNEMTSDAYQRWTTEEARDEHVWIVPPWRKANHPDRKDRGKADGHYFSDRSLAFRAAFRAAVGHEEHDPTEPASVTTMRIADDAALRDLLIEGSGILVERGSRSETRLALAIHDDPVASPMAKNRAALALDGVPPSVPAWATPLAKAIAGDIRSLIPGGEVRKVDWRVDWTSPFVDPRPDSLKSPTALADMRDQLWVVVDSLKSEDLAKLGATLVRRSSRGQNDEGRDVCDQHFLIRDWCRNFWREPWHERDPMPDGSSWVRALVALLEFWVPEAVGIDAKRTAHGRFDSEGTFRKLSDRHGLEILGRTPFVVRHATAHDTDLMLLWRLLWPLGTIFQGNTLIVSGGERGKIEAGLVLA
jgi:hypothetical protein